MKKQFRLLYIFIAAALSLNLTGCSNQMSETGMQNATGWWGAFSAKDILVLGADKKPLVNAQILIGSSVGEFSGNFITTNSSGRASLPAGWRQDEPVTIDAPGYVRATYYAQKPGAHAYQLRSQVGTTQYEVSGVTQGHPVVDKDGFIDFGLVIPALTRNDLMGFDMGAVISSQMDTISVFGQEAKIPSNVALPKQRESYYFPLTIEKPKYRLYFGAPGVKKVYAARGRFPFEEVVDRIRAKEKFYNLINYFTISGGGIKDIAVTNPVTQVNLSVTDINFSSSVKVVAPRLAGDETMLAVTVAPVGESLIPMDVKNLQSGEKREMMTMDRNALLVSILKKTNEMESRAPGGGRLSAVLVSAANAAPEFLPLMSDLNMTSGGDILVPKTSSIPGVSAVATYSLISEQVEVVQGGEKVKIKRATWEVYAPGWIEAVSLPAWPDKYIDNLEVQNGVKKVWEVNLIGSLNTSQVDLGPAMINDATHVTHSALEF